MGTVLTVMVATAVGAGLWTLAEYLLHRFAMHQLGGRGLMSREHLEHHVGSTWTFAATHVMSWIGMLAVGAVVWLPLGRWLAGTAAGVALMLGWAGGYFFYETHHALAHRRGPSGRYGRWIRRHHLHHHFGGPRSNHGVSTSLWDRVFGTYRRPERVRVPRRLALPWMLDDHGALRPELDDDYVLVGSADRSERTAALDRARAFASAPPVD